MGPLLTESMASNPMAFLDLPTWWCGISIFLFFGFLFFLVWAFFKGRRLLRQKEKATGMRNVRCSSCGANMLDYLERCPSCNARFISDRYCCPRCGAIVGRQDETCRDCSEPLAEPSRYPRSGEGHGSKGDPDLEKLKKKAFVKDRYECRMCGAIVGKGTVSCPVCKSADIILIRRR